MKAALIERGGDLAAVRPFPSRLARWFGAGETVLELVRETTRYSDGTHFATTWRAAATGTPLSHLPHSSLIARALDFVSVAAPPRAVAVDESGTWLFQRRRKTAETDRSSAVTERRGAREFAQRSAP